MRFASVYVDLSAEALDRSFTYLVPEGMDIAPGDMVNVPFGKKTLEGFVTEIKPETDIDPAKLKPVLGKALEFRAVSDELLDLADWMREKYSCTMADCLRLMIPSELRGGRVRERRIRVAELKSDADEALTLCKRAKLQQAVIEMLRDGPKPVRFMEELEPGTSAAVTALVKKGLVTVTEERTLRAPEFSDGGRSHTDPVLTECQQRAADELNEALAGAGGRFLLHGITGSGKTEVYINVIRKALSMGRGAIILVPEIALTPQMVSWLHARFGDTAAVIHSRLSAGERFDEWDRIRTGEARVAIGARSAVFAPVKNLGVVIVDEEHEGAYLSEKRPRYDAREVAQRRAETNGGVLILGSATPCVSTYMRTLPRVRPENKLCLLELDKRANGRPLPECEIVDMREELQLGNKSIFSAALVNALTECFNGGKQAMLFINRRGHSTFVSCRSCGYVVKCDACAVTMSFHQYENSLKCHYCGAEKPVPTVCPQCGSRFIKYFGAGTQKVEEEVRRLFPGVQVSRMDADTTGGKDSHERILEEFRSGRTQVLVGTQMIAKGLDFPKVTVVGVVAADTTLNLPDFRSAERTFQLVTQVAGRAGRADDPGKVIVQTYSPEHYAVQCAVKQDYRAFFNTEERYRKRSYYPPYTTIARIVYRSGAEDEARKAAQQAEKELRQSLMREELFRETLVIASGEAPINRLRGEYRWQLYVKMYSTGKVQAILSLLEELAAREIAGVIPELEVNPSSMI